MNVLFQGQTKLLMNNIVATESISDIEHVLQFLEVFRKFINDDGIKSFFLKNKALTLHLQGGSLALNEMDSVFNELYNRIITETYSEYETKPDSIELIKDIYSDLFRKFINKKIKSSSIMNIYTTNYDRVIEEYCNYYSTLILKDGFTYVDSIQQREWNPDQEYTSINVTNKQIVNLYKLHGSLNWRITYDDRIVNVNTEEYVSNSNMFKRNLVIYPSEKNYERTEPFKTLYNYFKKSIEKTFIYIIIGFSFRDDALNNVFLDFLKQNNKYMIVVSPKAKRVVQENLFNNQPALYELYKNQIYNIEGYFGHPDVTDELNSILTEIGDSDILDE